MIIHLASTSPRRVALLRDAGIAFRLVEPGPEPAAAGPPRARAIARAESKARGARVGDGPAGLVVGVDTVVDVDGEEFGKPRGPDDAARMLARLQGREHEVHTAVCVVRHPDDGASWSAVETSVVRFAPVDADAIGRHVRSGSWDGKAGGYGIQDADVARFASVVVGRVDTVIGLPVGPLRDLLARAAEGPG